MHTVGMQACKAGGRPTTPCPSQHWHDRCRGASAARGAPGAPGWPAWRRLPAAAAAAENAAAQGHNSQPLPSVFSLLLSGRGGGRFGGGGRGGVSKFGGGGGRGGGRFGGGGRDGGRGRGRGGRDGGRGGRGGRGGMKGGAKTVVEQHRHAGIFIARGKEDALVTRNMAPGESVYGEKRVSVEQVGRRGAGGGR